MLVLSRKWGEKIYIGENIILTVMEIDHAKIRLGIAAPRSVRIYRQEILPTTSASSSPSQENTSNTTERLNTLVLSRKPGEKIYIGEHVIVTVVNIDRKKTRLGIEAPREVLIFRQEVLPRDHPQHPASQMTPKPPTDTPAAG